MLCWSLLAVAQAARGRREQAVVPAGPSPLRCQGMRRAPGLGTGGLACRRLAAWPRASPLPSAPDLVVSRAGWNVQGACPGASCGSDGENDPGKRPLPHCARAFLLPWQAGHGAGEGQRMEPQGMLPRAP